MRLSDVRGARTFDVIAECIDPISNIAADKEAVEFFARKKLPEGMTAAEFVVRRIKRSLPILLKNHKQDLIAVFSAIEGISAEEYEKGLTLVKLVQDTTELLNDEAFKAFFISAQTGTTSGSAQENLEETP